MSAGGSLFKSVDCNQECGFLHHNSKLQQWCSLLGHGLLDHEINPHVTFSHEDYYIYFDNVGRFKLFMTNFQCTLHKIHSFSEHSVQASWFCFKVLDILA